MNFLVAVRLAELVEVFEFVRPIDVARNTLTFQNKNLERGGEILCKGWTTTIFHEVDNAIIFNFNSQFI